MAAVVAAYRVELVKVDLDWAARLSKIVVGDAH